MGLSEKSSNTQKSDALIVQVVPGEAGCGSFKIETLIAYRVEQRLGL